MESQNPCSTACCFLAFLLIIFGIGYWIFSKGGIKLVQEGHTIQDDFKRAEQVRERQGQTRDFIQPR